MNFFKLIVNNFKYFLHSQHIPMALGTMITSGVLIGALIVGDSVKESLVNITYNRLGNVTHAIDSGDRYFRYKLADEIENELEIPISPVLKLNGFAIKDGGEHRVNQAQILGIDKRFWNLAPDYPNFSEPAQNEALINEKLANQLDLKVDDEFLLRVKSIDYFPVDAPFALDIQHTASIRVKITGIVADNQLGRFNLQANQTSPFNIFVNYNQLATLVDIPGKCNTLLFNLNLHNSISYSDLSGSLKFNFKFGDASLDLSKDSKLGDVMLKSDRIFLEPVIGDLLDQSELNNEKYFTYFVNTLKTSTRSTPYSFVSSLDPDASPKIKNDEIVISSWLARDLNASKGDSLTLDYFIVGTNRDLILKSSVFKINSIITMPQAEKFLQLLPDFPGLSESDNCRDWDPGIPIDLDKIRDKDEEYWDEYHGTPKAFINLEKAQQLWGNRFGNMTAVKFTNEKYTLSLIENKILDKSTPSLFGINIKPVLEEGLAASKNGVDFGELFLSLSFFIIAASLILTGLLYVFSLEQRKGETGLYLALGYRPVQIKLLFFFEFFITAVIGVLLGSVVGILYDFFILKALGSIWIGAVGTSDLQLFLKPITILKGIGISLFLVVISIFIELKRQSIIPATRLQRRGQSYKITKLNPKIILYISAILLFGVIVILFLSDPGRGKQAYGAFFGGGSLLLVLGHLVFYYFIIQKGKSPNSHVKSIYKLAFSNTGRTRSKSIAITAILAIGVFLVITVGANRHGTLVHSDLRSSGTGGFEYWFTTTSPVLQDLNSPDGKDYIGIDTRNDSVLFLTMRHNIIDDASCLNLNMVKNPSIIGINANVLDSLQAFTFIKTLNNQDKDNPWLILNKNYGNNIIPAIADETVLVWGLGKAVGDTLYYTSENGQELKVLIVGSLAGSVFQGNILISEDNFVDNYPSIGGYRIFLANIPTSLKKQFELNVPRLLMDHGIEWMPAYERLAQFHTIENTYLSIFLILGALGLLLGSIGLGIVILRNILERRSELALFTALGFTLSKIKKLVIIEHVILLISGLIIGTLSALFAMMPVFFTPGSEVPYLTVLLIVLALPSLGTLWIYLFTYRELLKPLLPALKND